MFIKKNLHLGQKLIDYEIFQFECPFTGWGKDLKKNSGVAVDTFIFIKRGNEASFYFNMVEWKRIGKQYLEIIQKDPIKLLNVINDIIKYSTKLYEYCQKIPSVNKLKKLNDRQLNNIYQGFHKWHHKYWNLAMTPNILELENSYLIDYVMSLVEKNKDKVKTKQSVFEIFNQIIYFEKRTWMEKKNEDYYRLLMKLRKENRASLINVFYNRYCWLEFNWIGPAQDVGILLDQIKRDLKSKKDFSEKLKQIIQQRTNNLKQKNKFKKELSLSKKDDQLVSALERLYFSKTYRMDCSYHAYYQMEKVFQEIAWRLHLSFFQVRSILPNEMKKYLVDRIVDVNKLNQYYRNSVFIWNGKKNVILLGEKAEKFIKEMTVKDYTGGKKIKEFKGQIAFRGKVKGRCKVVNQRSELKKFKQGDILISGHTDPSLMPAIVKAKAIVTNFGGMTCHAAIVSRELKIPCVIGTKMATEVLKDGDRVEVDANKGIIKKI